MRIRRTDRPASDTLIAQLLSLTLQPRLTLALLVDDPDGLKDPEHVVVEFTLEQTERIRRVVNRDCSTRPALRTDPEALAQLRALSMSESDDHNLDGEACRRCGAPMTVFEVEQQWSECGGCR